MSYVRSYVMQAKPGAAEELRAVLDDLRAVVRGLPGSLRVDLMRNLDEAGTYHFVELWVSREAHSAAGKLLPKALMDRLKPCLGGPPDSYNLELVG